MLVRGGEVRSMKRFYALITLLLAACLMAPEAFGQSLISGDISGTVTDPSGAVVANATVVLKKADTGQSHTDTTNASGSYHFSLLPPGTYVLSVTAPGFSKTESQVNVNIGQTTV